MDPFIGEIRQFAFNFVPKFWAACNGQTMPIRQQTTLYSLIGTQFGGDGVNSFGLPNLVNNLTIGTGQARGGNNWQNGNTTGSTTVTLNQQQMAAHNHNLTVTSATASTGSAAGQQLANGFAGGRQNPIRALVYTNDPNPGVSLNQQSLAQNGGGAAHNNMMPYLAMNFVIALSGIFPDRP